MSVAGVDYSTKAVDIVLLDESTDAATWHRFELPGPNAFDRTRLVRPALAAFASRWDDVLAVGIEDPRGYGAGSLYRVQGAVLACIPVMKLVQPWIPSQWRKAVGLPGNASKDDVADFVIGAKAAPRDRWVWPQDACDAFCIALATRSLLQIGEAA